jgi:hypothetical protein
MLDILDKDIGGARVRRTFATFKAGQEFRYKAGDMLTAEQVLAIPIANRRALSDSSFIEVFPKHSSSPDAERFIVASDVKNKFNVYEGIQVNDEPLTHEQAKALLRDF